MYKDIDWYIWRSVDGGADWTRFRRWSHEKPQIVEHPSNSSVIYILASNFMELSMDGGGTWTTPELIINGTNPRLYFSNDNNVIYAASTEKTAISKDMGSHWKFCPTTSFAPFADSETRLAVNPQDANQVYLATFGHGVIVSKNGCDNWLASNTGLNNLFVNTLVIDPNNATIYAGTEDGAYISTDNAQTWHPINDGLLGSQVYSIVVDKDSNVYAATPYGIFKLESK